MSRRRRDRSNPECASVLRTNGSQLKESIVEHELQNHWKRSHSGLLELNRTPLARAIRVADRSRYGRVIRIGAPLHQATNP